MLRGMESCRLAVGGVLGWPESDFGVGASGIFKRCYATKVCQSARFNSVYEFSRLIPSPTRTHPADYATFQLFTEFGDLPLTIAE